MERNETTNPYGEDVFYLRDNSTYNNTHEGYKEDLSFYNLTPSDVNFTYNNTYEGYEEIVRFYNLTRTLVPVILGLLTAFGSLGNILTIVFILLQKTKRGIVSYLILNVAVADSLYVILSAPFHATQYALLSWPFGAIWCRIQTYLMCVLFFASMYVFVLVSLDRYIALVHPLRAIQLRRKRNGYVALFAVWSLVILGNMPFLFHANDGDTMKQNGFCTLSIKSAFITLISFFTFGYLLPLMCLFVIYIHMLKVFFTRKSPAGLYNGDRIRQQAKGRVTKMIALVVICFIVSWTPYQFIIFCFALSPPVNITVTLASLIIVAEFLTYMNTCINPIFYALYTNIFRNRFKNMVCFRRT